MLAQYKVSVVLLSTAVALSVLATYSAAAEINSDIKLVDKLHRRVLSGLQIALAIAVAVSSIFYMAAPDRFLISENAKSAALAYRDADEKIAAAGTRIAEISALSPEEVTPAIEEERAEQVAIVEKYTQVKLDAMNVCTEEAKEKGLASGPADPFVSACLRSAYGSPDNLVADQDYLNELANN